VTPAIVIHAYGGVEQLTLSEIDLGSPGPGEVLIRHTGIGVNYIDTYFRRGIYPIPLPAVIGDQAVGLVEALGPGVSELAEGDTVAYGSVARAYCERRVIRADQVVRIPDGVDPDVVAATLTRAMTAEYLLFRLHAVQPDETVIVHAAVGGTGLLMVQWARHLGARVIATVGSESKFAAARQAGADQVLLHQQDDFVEQVKAMTGGRGVDVVYDSVGKDTFEKSLECLRRRGLMVAYGNASGKPDPYDVLGLSRLGSLYLTRPRLNDYVAERAELELSAGRVFEALDAGVLRPHPVKRFALADAAAAHLHLEDRAELSIPILAP